MQKVTVSDLGYFSECRRRWLWGKKYFLLQPNKDMWLGSGVHKALDAYFRTERNPKLAIPALQSWARDSYLKMSRFTPEWDTARHGYDTLLDLATGIVQNFLQYDQETEFLSGTVVASETTLRYTLGHFNLVGKLDLILEESDGSVILIDHKTFSSPPSLRALEVDNQLTAYAYLFWKTQDRIPDGIAYNVLFKGAPKAPEILKNGTLSRAKSQYTTAALYRKAILENDQRLVDYVDILEYLDTQGWSQFFQRVDTLRTRTELESFEARTLSLCQDLVKAIDKPEVWAYPNPSLYRCSSCEYNIPCKLAEEGGDPSTYLESQFTSEYLY